MLLLALLLLLSPAQAAPSGAIQEEKIYRDYQRRLLLANPPRMKKAPSPRLARISLDAIEDLIVTGYPLALEKIIPPNIASQLEAREHARWYRIRGLQKKNSIEEERSLVESLSSESPSPGLLYELLRQRSSFVTAEARALVERTEKALPEETLLYTKLRARAFTSPSSEEVKALFNMHTGKPSLYMFCRHNRNYKCLLALKDKDGKPVRSSSNLWTQPALGLSSRGLPFNVRNGYTPSGVHLINGVMPEANLPAYYGKYRRMILEFVPASADEAEQKKLLPESAHGSSWWKEAIVARDMGRTELRIHGSGGRTDDTTKPYYPFVPTIGCVAQREGKYGDVTYSDQRLLLDRLMRAGGLNPIFANESLIQGLLYVVELDDGSGAVGLADLARFGIL